MGVTKIQWTDATWNPVRGCSMAKGSETGGCLNCYAARMAARNLPELKSPTTGNPFARMMPSGPRWTGDVELIESALTLPLHWKKPRRVFVNSMSDLFHEALPDEAIDRVFAVMALCPQHSFQCLTKRPERMLEYVTRLSRNISPLETVAREVGYTFKFNEYSTLLWPIPNVWLGVSVEDQKTADERIPSLLQTPAAVRFVSYEPALGPVDFTGRLKPGELQDELHINYHPPQSHAGLDWIIVGGESGPCSRPFDTAWARNTIAQCEAAAVACFVKQLGARAFEGLWVMPRRGGDQKKYLRLGDRKGGDWLEWAEDLRVRQFPGENR